MGSRKLREKPHDSGQIELNECEQQDFEGFADLPELKD
jgi:hypothetical protein